MSGLTATQLLARYESTEWRRNFVDACDLMQVLGDCLISDDYTITDALNEALPLTTEGNDLKGRLIRREEVPAKEAHLMTALTIGHAELLLDVERIDFEALVRVISRQIRDRRLRFPLVFGRSLYDAYADTFDEEKDFLSTLETARLLDSVPFGVFQYGRFVVGPSGMRTSDVHRMVPFSRRVRAYHCSDLVCRELHTVLLSTGHNAAINAQRDKLTKILEAESDEAADWFGLADEARGQREAYYRHHWVVPLIPLLGDCLSLAELQAVIEQVESSAPNTERPVTAGSRAHAELLEQTLMFDDVLLARTIDDLVRRGVIEVPRGEVRRPVSTSNFRSGAYRFQAELGADGVRSTSQRPGLAVLRARDLIRKIYLTGNEDERQELEWQLRSVDGVSIEVRLDEYLRKAPPTESLARLVLTRKTSAIAASELAALGDIDGADDNEVVSRLLWKLGFDHPDEGDEHHHLWTLHERLSATVQGWLGTQSMGSDDFRGLASTFFSSLEGVLGRSLAFATWALLNDHSATPAGFSFNGEADDQAGWSLLRDNYKLYAAPTEDRLDIGSRPTMHHYVRGFGALADTLQGLESKRAEFERPADQYPDYARATGLQTYPFVSTIPFLDLAPHSRRRIVDCLRDVTDTLVAGDVVAVRNDYSHYRRTSPEVEKMASTLESVGPRCQKHRKSRLRFEFVHAARRSSRPVGSSDV